MWEESTANSVSAGGGLESGSPAPLKQNNAIPVNADVAVGEAQPNRDDRAGNAAYGESDPTGTPTARPK